MIDAAFVGNVRDQPQARLLRESCSVELERGRPPATEEKGIRSIIRIRVHLCWRLPRRLPGSASASGA